MASDSRGPRLSPPVVCVPSASNETMPVKGLAWGLARMSRQVAQLSLQLRADGPTYVHLAQRLAHRKPRLRRGHYGLRLCQGTSGLPTAASSLGPGGAPTQASSSLFLVNKADGQLLKEEQGSSLHPQDGEGHAWCTQMAL